MQGSMMDFPLALDHLARRLQQFFSKREVVHRNPDRSISRTTYGEVHARAAQLAHALRRLGLKPGDRVGTLAWNHAAHLEQYLGVPASGLVLHTLNLRLHPSEIGYIANHAGDKAILVDASLLPLLEKFRADVKTLEHVIVVGGDRASLPPGAIDYDELLAPEARDYPWHIADERSAAMICYTSGTTGNPKGVVFSHRSMVLHTFAACLADCLGLVERDVVLPVVPMFHANAWGLPFAAMATGAKLVFPGPHLDPLSLLDLMATERVTFAAGVPTIWIGILALLDQEPERWDLKSIRAMLIGGSAAPPSMIEGFKQRHGLTVTHAWGMTETNPLGTIARLRLHHEGLNDQEKLHVSASQGYASFFIETRHVDDASKELPWDGKAMGELEVRGPWVASAYLGGEGADRFTKDGWFKTGDVVTIDEDGYLRITDRSKDVIKSGGEWISTVALENALMAHASVLEAAVFAAKHAKWDERPVAAVVLKDGRTATKEELLTLLEGRFAKFWMPDEILFVAQIPRTSTGKFLKSKLRELYGDVLLTGVG